MNEKQIDCFIEAGTYLNFHKAAEKLYMSQPSVSYQIDALEHEVGVALFEKSGRGVALTPAGRSLYDSLIEIRTMIDRAVETCRATARGTKRDLLVSWPPVVCERDLMLGLAEAFRAHEPRIELTIAVTDRVDVFGQANGRQADVLITIQEDIEEIGGYTSYPLFEERNACLVSTSHPLAKTASITYDMLRSQTVLLMPPGSYLGSYRRALENLKVHLPSSSIRYLDNNSDIEMNVAAGRGISIRPIRPDRMGQPHSGLVAVPFDPPVITHLCAAYAGEDVHGNKRRFCTFAQEFFSDGPDRANDDEPSGANESDTCEGGTRR